MNKATGAATSARPAIGNTPSSTVPSACTPIGTSIQRLASRASGRLSSRAAPRKITPNARVMLSAETAPTKASAAPTTASASFAQMRIVSLVNSPE